MPNHARQWGPSGDEQRLASADNATVVFAVEQAWRCAVIASSSPPGVISPIGLTFDDYWRTLLAGVSVAKTPASMPLTASQHRGRGQEFRSGDFMDRDVPPHGALLQFSIALATADAGSRSTQPTPGCRRYRRRGGGDSRGGRRSAGAGGEGLERVGPMMVPPDPQHGLLPGVDALRDRVQFQMTRARRCIRCSRRCTSRRAISWRQ